VARIKQRECAAEAKEGLQLSIEVGLCLKNEEEEFKEKCGSRFGCSLRRARDEARSYELQFF
jgi:hypothetical protein